MLNFLSVANELTDTKSVGDDEIWGNVDYE